MVRRDEDLTIRGWRADDGEAATAGWFAADGTCAGFVIGVRHPDHGVPEVRAMIASTNLGSLGLHAAAGFVERARKQLWDLPLDAR